MKRDGIAKRKTNNARDAPAFVLVLMCDTHTRCPFVTVVIQTTCTVAQTAGATSRRDDSHPKEISTDRLIHRNLN